MFFFNLDAFMSVNTVIADQVTNDNYIKAHKFLGILIKNKIYSEDDFNNKMWEIKNWSDEQIEENKEFYDELIMLHTSVEKFEKRIFLRLLHDAICKPDEKSKDESDGNSKE